MNQRFSAGWLDEDHMSLLKKFARRADARKFSCGVMKMTGFRLLALKHRILWLNVQARNRKQ